MPAGVAGFVRGDLDGDGVTGRSPASARRMNWNGVKFGEHAPEEEDVLRDCGLVPLGVDS